MNQVLQEIDACLEYHVQLSMQEAKNQQWLKQRAIEEAQEQKRIAKRKKLLLWLLFTTSLITLFCISYYFDFILSYFA